MIIHTPTDLGKLIFETRRLQKLTQIELAATTGVGVRFIQDLEKGKPTCHIGKILLVIMMLGLEIHIERKNDALKRLLS